ncbi:MAG TPA: hypothetical protein VI321_00740 [Burkholderiales bacterium]
MLLTARHKSGRTFWLMYVSAIWIAIACALPVASVAYKSSRAAPEWPGVARQAPIARSPYRTFEQLDRNRDGGLDKSEVAPIPGLSALFERADRNEDGLLDRTEYARALNTLVGPR